jgi:hypothetical protein
MTTNQLYCKTCGDPLTALPDQTAQGPDNGPLLDVFECTRCQIKSVLITEPVGGITAKQESWVEREVAARGSFFPQDYRPGGHGRLRD